MCKDGNCSYFAHYAHAAEVMNYILSGGGFVSRMMKLLRTDTGITSAFGLYDYQSPQYLNYDAGDETQLAALRCLSREDVNRAARKYLDPNGDILTSLDIRRS